MNSNMFLTALSLILITIICVVRSAPVEPSNQLNLFPLKTLAESIKSSIAAADPTAASVRTLPKEYKTNDMKKKRDIEDYLQFDEFADNDSDEQEDDVKIEHKLHAIMKETPVQVHANADKSVDTDNSKVFTDITMNPDEFTNLARRRRHINRNDQANQRHKRALSPYEFYNIDPLYESSFDRQQFVRPARSFSPIYWYPPAYERNIRSTALPASFYERPDWNRIEADSSENDEDQDTFLDDDEYEYNRYPIVSDSLNIPYDNLQLQQKYNIEEFPAYDEDEDEGEEYIPIRYDSLDSYFK